MKKKLMSGIIIVAIVIGIFSFPIYQKDDVTKNENVNVNKQSSNNELISIMLETDVNSGKYSLSNEFPGAFYEINKDLSGCENGSELQFDSSTNKVTLKTNISDKCYLYFDKQSFNFTNYIKSLYTTQGSNNIYYHDSSLENGANDNSYRFAGNQNSVNNNYVCFGSMESTCPEENLYRIIGVFGDNVKLIKSTTYGNYKFDKNFDINNLDYDYAITESTLLNDVLNQTYINELGDWEKLIVNNDYLMGPILSFMETDTANTLKFYQEELSSTVIKNMKIGLMYVSDYGFSALPTNYTIGFNSWVNKSWLVDVEEVLWTIDTVENAYTDRIDCKMNKSKCGIYSTFLSSSNEVRPVFYLSDTTEINSGDGTSTNPYRIVM